MSLKDYQVSRIMAHITIQHPFGSPNIMGPEVGANLEVPTTNLLQYVANFVPCQMPQKSDEMTSVAIIEEKARTIITAPLKSIEHEPSRSDLPHGPNRLNPPGNNCQRYSAQQAHRKDHFSSHLECFVDFLLG